jgi:hypothetical protein
MRTPENDNDKANKYFREPTVVVRQKDLETKLAEDNDANALIQKLRQQSEDNRDKNEKIIQQKTFMNDKVSFVIYPIGNIVRANISSSLNLVS